MRKLESKEIKKILFDMFKYLNKVCEENDIMCLMAYGSVLGAVRHKGFIPWDDDIDVHIMRPEYKKLLEVLEKDNHPYYKIYHKGNSNLYFGGYAMLVDTRTAICHENILDDKMDGLGVYIDILPLDGVGNSNNLAIFQKKVKYTKVFGSLSILKKIPPAGTKFKTIVKKICAVYAKYKGLDYFTDKIEKMALANDFHESQYLGDVTWYIDAIYPKYIFEGYDYAEFEGEKVKIPKDYDTYLTLTYGDYMKLPPVEQRECVHTYQYYSKD